MFEIEFIRKELFVKLKPYIVDIFIVLEPHKNRHGRTFLNSNSTS